MGRERGGRERERGRQGGREREEGGRSPASGVYSSGANCLVTSALATGLAEVQLQERMVQCLLPGRCT
jgi:hypothetical protein